jgi:hypothetical protein
VLRSAIFAPARMWATRQQSCQPTTRCAKFVTLTLLVAWRNLHPPKSCRSMSTSCSTNYPTQAKIGLEWATRPQQDTLADALKSLKQGVSRRLIGAMPSISSKSGTTISTFEIIRNLWRSGAIFTAIR